MFGTSTCERVVCVGHWLQTGWGIITEDACEVHTHQRYNIHANISQNCQNKSFDHPGALLVLHFKPNQWCLACQKISWITKTGSTKHEWRWIWVFAKNPEKAKLDMLKFIMFCLQKQVIKFEQAGRSSRCQWNVDLHFKLPHPLSKRQAKIACPPSEDFSTQIILRSSERYHRETEKNPKP
jgi:hypothetical protein